MSTRTRDELQMNNRSLDELHSAMISQQARHDEDAVRTKVLIDAMTNRFESLCRGMQDLGG